MNKQKHVVLNLVLVKHLNGKIEDICETHGSQEVALACMPILTQAILNCCQDKQNTREARLAYFDGHMKFMREMFETQLC